MAIRATLTLLEFLETFPNDEFFIRESDEEGPFVYPVKEAMLRQPKDSPVWHQKLRVLWNDAGTVAVTSKVADPCQEPDRPAVVFLHQNLVFGFLK